MAGAFDQFSMDQIQNEFNSQEIFGGLDGDFYQEPDLVTRGITLQPQNLAGFGFETLSPIDGSKSFEKALTKVQPALSFADVLQAPEVPFGGYAPTSLLLEHTSAARAMSFLHTFFENEVTGSIIKLRPEKCSITAEVFIEDAHGFFAQCSVKTRLFQPFGPGLVLEARRRGGDSLAFGKVFKRLTEYFHEPVRTPLETLSMPVFAPPLEMSDSQALQPVIDMVTNESSAQMQAEGLASLLVLANVATTAAVTVAFEHVEEVLAGLIISPLLSVAFPAARLASMLDKPGSELLQVAAQKAVADEATSGLVRAELTKFMQSTHSITA